MMDKSNPGNVDASKFEVGGKLKKLEETVHERVIAFFSKMFSSADKD